jgi:hypothetical protein
MRALFFVAIAALAAAPMPNWGHAGNKVQDGPLKKGDSGQRTQTIALNTKLTLTATFQAAGDSELPAGTCINKCKGKKHKKHDECDDSCDEKCDKKDLGGKSVHQDLVHPVA